MPNSLVSRRTEGMTSRPHSQPECRDAIIDLCANVEVHGDVETESQAKNDFQQGYAVGFQDTSYRFRQAIRALKGTQQRSEVQSRDAIKALSEMFSESVHKTWTKDEIVNILEDAIAMGSPALPSADRLPVVTTGLVPDPNSASGYSVTSTHRESGK